MARRRFHVFSMSFLDIISCGFGAVVLFFVIINAQVRLRADAERIDLLSESTQLEVEVLEGRKDLLQLRGERDTLDERRAIAIEELRKLRERLAALLAELAEYERLGTQSEESVEKLRADVDRLREMQEELEARVAEAEEGTGQRVRGFEGSGERQYLTGMQMGGDRVLILVDGSASMLGRTYIDVLRFRLMDEELKPRAPKWVQVVNSVDWITTRLEPQQRFQVYIFGVEHRSILEDTDGQWLSVADGARVTEAIEALRRFAPEGGDQPACRGPRHPRHGAAAGQRLPLDRRTADAGRQSSLAGRMGGYARAGTFLYPRGARSALGDSRQRAVLPDGRGTPAATGYYWLMASQSRGSFVSVSRDWP